MTLFLCEIDRQNQTIEWVNAGHEPALIYNHNTDAHVELSGGGLPLGVSEKTAYQKFQMKISPGQIVLIGTDGIWESQNQTGEMFGKDRFRNIIKEHANEPAKKILNAIIGAIDDFSQAHVRGDDVTLVVVKIKPD